MYFMDPEHLHGLTRGLPNEATREKQILQQVDWSMEKSCETRSRGICSCLTTGTFSTPPSSAHQYWPTSTQVITSRCDPALWCRSNRYLSAEFCQYFSYANGGNFSSDLVTQYLPERWFICLLCVPHIYSTLFKEDIKKHYTLINAFLEISFNMSFTCNSKAKASFS